MRSARHNIAWPFSLRVEREGSRDALIAGARRFTYSELAGLVMSLGAHLDKAFTHGRVGILASRSAEACIGILSTAWAGGTYVPLGLKLPEGRLIELFGMLQLDAVIVDHRGLNLLSPAVLAHAPKLIAVPTVADAARLSRPGTIAIDSLGGFEALYSEPAAVEPDHLAYIEFTSGTTGRPKGVMVSSRAVRNYVEVSQHWYQFGPEDRAAETCDITFDLSVHNMFCAWGGGASLYLMSPLDMTFPAQFIRKHQITTWLSVPSVAGMMRNAGALRESSLPSLRLSLFCGEALPVSIAEAWSKAAPSSVVENIYGPTEATVACLRQTWSEAPRTTPTRGVVAIGRAYPGMEAQIVDSNRRPLPDSMPGEIALAGVQLAEGYLDQVELTTERFPVIEGQRWYLTGDLGMRDEEGVFHHLGRLDNQIKVQGHRVELEEVEMHLRKASGADMVAAVPLSNAHGAVEGLLGFCIAGAEPAPVILERLRQSLPSYMVPRRIEFRDALPLNANGKIDRNSLVAELKSEQAQLAPAQESVPA